MLNEIPDTKKILLADDDADDRYFFQEALNEIPGSFCLKTAQNGYELLDILDRCKISPDVIFLDLNMPRKNGYDSLAALKANEKTNHIPTVIFSTALQENMLDDLREMGALLYIVKPVEFSVMVSLLKDVLAMDLLHADAFSEEHFVLRS